MGISREFLATRTPMIPGRIKVKVYEREKKDRWLEPFEVLAEKRHQFVKGSDGSGIPIKLHTFVFNLVELKGRKLSEGDVIQDIESNEFWAIATDKDCILGQRIHCPVMATVDPIGD